MEQPMVAQSCWRDVDYTTSNGYELKLGRIPRVAIDAFVAQHPMPEPPMRAVPVFGGIEEDIPDTDNPEYQTAVGKWLVAFGNEQIGLILPAIEFEPDSEFLDLQEIAGFTTEAGIRAHVLEDPVDFAEVINCVFYNSTVTPVGISEAEKAFDVTWFDRDISLVTLPPSPAKYGLLFESREAARFAFYNWDEFCELPGPEQSAIVAHYRLERRLQWLMSRK